MHTEMRADFSKEQCYGKITNLEKMGT